MNSKNFISLSNELYFSKNHWSNRVFPLIVDLLIHFLDYNTMKLFT